MLENVNYEGQKQYLPWWCQGRSAVSEVSIYTEFDCNQWPNIIELNGGDAIVDKP